MKYIYRERTVSGLSHLDPSGEGVAIDIPDGSIEIHVFQDQTSMVDFFRTVCWLEPAKEGPKKSPGPATNECVCCGTHNLHVEGGLCPKCKEAVR